MIRSELCAIAGMSVAAFNARQREGDLPWDTSAPGERRDDEGRVWSNFSVDHAAHLLAAVQLADAGLSWTDAARFLREPRVPVPRSAQSPGGSYIVARADFLREGGGVPDHCPPSTTYSGAFADILAAVQRDLERYNRQSAHNAWQKIGLSALIAVDLGRARRVAQARADEIGLADEQLLRIDPDAEPVG